MSLTKEQFDHLSAEADRAIRDLSATETLQWYQNNRETQRLLDEYVRENPTSAQMQIVDPNSASRPR